MRRRIRRRQYVSTELDITAFLNLMVILIPFLLITAVFSRVTVLDLYLPPEAESTNTVQKKFQLEIVIRKDEIYINEAASRLRQRIKLAESGFDYSELQAHLLKLKSQFPDKRDATILAESEIEYDILIQVMDHVRMREVRVNNNVVLEDLFPGISIGDAPANSKETKQQAKRK